MLRTLGLVTLRLVPFFRCRRFDLCNQDSISINLGCISSALHRFSGIINLADHLACVAVALSTADNKFTVACFYAVEHRHHAHNCSGLDFAARAFFSCLEVAPAFVVRRLCGLVCGTYLSLRARLLEVTMFQSPVAGGFCLALVSLSVCDLLYSRATAPCRSLPEVVPMPWKCHAQSGPVGYFCATYVSVASYWRGGGGQQTVWAVNSLWFKALRCKGDGLCGGSCGSLLARLRLDASLRCGHIFAWSVVPTEVRVGDLCSLAFHRRCA